MCTWQSGLDNFLCSQKVLKYADKIVIEFQSNGRNILMKIHADIFILKSSALKCFYCVSQLLLHDPSDLATTLTAWTSCLWTSYPELKLNAYTGCPRRNVRDFGRVFLMLNNTNITQNTYIQSWMVTEIMAREVWNFDSCYSLIDYQIHIETGRNMWFL